MQAESLSHQMRDPIRAVPAPSQLLLKALISINILAQGGRDGVCGQQLQGQTSRWIIRSYTAIYNGMMIRENTIIHFFTCTQGYKCIHTVNVSELLYLRSIYSLEDTFIRLIRLMVSSYIFNDICLKL